MYLTWQGFKAIFLPKELIQRSNFTYILIKSTLNRLQGITQKRTHLCLKSTGYHAEKYIQLWSSVSNPSFQQKSSNLYKDVTFICDLESY